MSKPLKVGKLFKKTYNIYMKRCKICGKFISKNSITNLCKDHTEKIPRKRLVSSGKYDKKQNSYYEEMLAKSKWNYLKPYKK